MLMCDFSESLSCKRCGYKARQRKTFRQCRTIDEMAEDIAAATAPPWVPVPNPMLGDRVANALAYFGITKERVSAAVGGDCGCNKRQTGLNRVGGVVAKTVEFAIDRAVAAVIGDREQDGAADAIRGQLLASPDVNEGLKDGPPSA
jgi:hypothetical protein